MDILALLQHLNPILAKTTIRQMSLVIYAVLAMTGRVTMLGISRWSDESGSYRTVQRFFQTTIPWAQVFWSFFLTHLRQTETVYVLAGDESVINKAGKQTYGLDRFSEIVALRQGKPTLFLTINRYNDWIGWPGYDLPPEGIEATRLVIDAWNKMICAAAEANGFLCADIYHVFNGPDGLTPSGDLLANDYTHPSDKGNEIIANILIELGFAPLVP